MTFAPFGRIDISPLLNYLELLDITDIYILETAKLLFKIKNELIPVAFGNYFESRNANVNHQYNLRSRGGRTTSINCKTVYGQRSLQYRDSEIWKSIPIEICTSGTVTAFKKQLKAHLLDSQVTEGVVSL